MPNIDDDYRRYTRHLFESLPPRSPLPTGTPPRLARLRDIRAVLFDIYGTLLVSASGDIDLVDVPADNLLTACDECGIDLTPRSRTNGQHLIDLMRAVVKEDHAAARANGIDYPEVDIRAIWRAVLDQAAAEGRLRTSAGADTARLALGFEVRGNPVYPMPGLRETLRHLANRLPLGVVSNAQFYTPLILHFFLNGSIQDNPAVPPFRPDLSIYSFQEGRGKPGTALYEKTAAQLGSIGLSPNQTLYVGNDMRNDIAPAAKTGFRTALFAGDRRSLRLREDMPEITAIKPDLIITALPQILECV